MATKRCGGSYPTSKQTRSGQVGPTSAVQLPRACQRCREARNRGLRGWADGRGPRSGALGRESEVVPPGTLGPNRRTGMIRELIVIHPERIRSWGLSES